MERIKRALAEARRQREALAEGSGGYAAKCDTDDSSGFVAADPVPVRPKRSSRLWICIVTAVIVVSILAYIIGGQYQKRRLDLAAFEVGRDATGGSVSQSEESLSTEQLEEDLASLQANVALVNESVILLYNKLTEVHQRVEAIAAVAAVAAVAAAENHAADEMQQSAADAYTASQVADREQGLAAPVAGTSDGPWVINLASFTDEPGAERFAVRAWAKDVDVEQKMVTVKGKNYWRVRATGFASAREARTQAGSLEARLGLKDAWVSRR